MKIWIDIGHPAQLNFYLNSIKELSKNNELLITVLDRGKLVKIALKEIACLDNCKVISLGHHSGSKLSAILDANMLRLLKLFKFYLVNKPQISLGNGFLHGIIGKIFGFKTIMFSDDIERKIPSFLMKMLASELYYVTGSDEKTFSNKKKIKIFNSLKEWAYLSPHYFAPNIDALLKYGVKSKKYIFVREVITGTLNYQSQTDNVIASFASEFPDEFKVLFSLEDKATLDQYPKDWILLEEPIEDIHSLIYYSRILVSSGDSMAREGSILGVPSIYCGVRDMKANEVMMRKGMLIHAEGKNAISEIRKIKDGKSFENQQEFRKKLSDEWIDVNQFIVDRIINYKSKI